MICVHNNWARHNKPAEYPDLHKYFYTGYSIFYGPAAKVQYEKHSHTPLTFKTTLQGYELYHYDNTTTRVSPDQYLLLNNGQEYFCEVEQPEQVQSLSVFFGSHVSADVLGCLKEKDEVLLENIGLWNDQPIYFFEKLYNYSPRLHQLKTSIAASIENQESKLELEGLLYNLLTELILQHNREKIFLNTIKARKPSTQKECYKRICYAVDYLHSNFQYNHIHLDILAKVTRLSPAHLSKLFKESFGISPYQYLKNIRLQKACSLLKSTSLDVKEIVQLIGYEDCSSFIRGFKIKYHMTPEAYRLA
jgi:AraC family transcriptional regulator